MQNILLLDEATFKKVEPKTLNQLCSSCTSSAPASAAHVSPTILHPTLPGGGNTSPIIRSGRRDGTMAYARGYDGVVAPVPHRQETRPAPSIDGAAFDGAPHDLHSPPWVMMGAGGVEGHEVDNGGARKHHAPASKVEDAVALVRVGGKEGAGGARADQRVGVCGWTYSCPVTPQPWSQLSARQLGPLQRW